MSNLNLLSIVAIATLLASASVISFKGLMSQGVDQMDHTVFKSWKLEYGKIYKSEAEESYRLTVFLQNLEKIDQMKKVVTHQVGLTKFSDLTPREFKIKYTGRRPRSSKYRSKIVHTVTDAPIPVSVDHKDCIPPIKDQGRCGSCWAFSAIVGTEFALNCPVGGPRSNTIHSLSEQQLVDCSGYLNNYGCNGGEENAGMAYVRDNGINSELSYPYTAKNGHCKNKISANVINQKSSFKFPFIQYYVEVQSASTKALESAVAQRVVTIAIVADNLSSYQSGILEGTACKGKVSDIDHAVAVVGFGVENGKKYWIIRNSWASNWGEKGYFRAIRGEGEEEFGCLCMLHEPSYPVSQTQ